MPLMNWDDRYSVHIRAIDEQHQEFFRLLNSLHDAMRSGEGRKTLGTTLNALVEYTQTHFTDEEQLMLAHNYPGFEKHKAIHQAFVAETLELQKKFASGNTMISIEVMQTLKNWLINHIQGTDLNYSVFLNDRGVR